MIAPTDNMQSETKITTTCVTTMRDRWDHRDQDSDVASTPQPASDSDSEDEMPKLSESSSLDIQSPKVSLRRHSRIEITGEGQHNGKSGKVISNKQLPDGRWGVQLDDGPMLKVKSQELKQVQQKFATTDGTSASQKRVFQQTTNEMVCPTTEFCGYLNELKTKHDAIHATILSKQAETNAINDQKALLQQRLDALDVEIEADVNQRNELASCITNAETSQEELIKSQQQLFFKLKRDGTKILGQGLITESESEAESPAPVRREV